MVARWSDAEALYVSLVGLDCMFVQAGNGPLELPPTRFMCGPDMVVAAEQSECVFEPTAHQDDHICFESQIDARKLPREHCRLVAGMNT